MLSSKKWNKLGVFVMSVYNLRKPYWTPFHELCTCLLYPPPSSPAMYTHNSIIYLITDDFKPVRNVITWFLIAVFFGAVLHLVQIHVCIVKIAGMQHACELIAAQYMYFTCDRIYTAASDHQVRTSCTVFLSYFAFLSSSTILNKARWLGVVH